jgi:tetratricopeptide (TPR) repeat protein
LEQYDKAIQLYGSTNAFLVAFCNANRAQILVRLGRYEDAQHVLDELFKSKETLQALVPELHLIQAQINLSKGDLQQASASASEAMKTSSPNPDTTIQAQYFLALAKAGSGEAQKLCSKSIEAASNASDFGLHSRALLACAEVAWKAKDSKTALTLATQAQERFARGSQLESEWRAWAIASRASKDLGDNNTAQEQWKNAESIRTRLEQQWGAGVFKQYAARPDIQVYYR